MEENEYLKIVKDAKELEVDKHDASYELVRETVKQYIGFPLQEVKYVDVDAIYFMCIGTWRHGIDKKKNLIEKSNLDYRKKEYLKKLLDELIQKSENGYYSNHEGESKGLIGMFGTGFGTFNGLNNDEMYRNFVELVTNLLNINNEDEALIYTQNELKNKNFKGFGTSSLSQFLHCLKPTYFPIINGKEGEGQKLYKELGIELDEKIDMKNYINNVLKIKKFRDKNCKFKNYRIIDLIKLPQVDDSIIRFSNWLKQNTNLINKTINTYCSNLRRIEKCLKIKIISLENYEDFKQIKENILDNEIFKEMNAKGHNGHSVALNHYEQYLLSKEGVIKKIDMEDERKTKYWWLNANPKTWSFSELENNGIIEYTSVNENGNKRKIFQNYLDAKRGDMIIAYEATPTKEIVGLCQVDEELKDNVLKIRKLETLINPVKYSEFSNTEEFKNTERNKNQQGSFFKLTEDEYNFLLDLIREYNPKTTQKSLGEYTEKEFLEEVYTSSEEYKIVVNLLKRKKNIILQGAPGVGKTFMAKRLAYSIMGEKDKTRIMCIQFHQSYSYEDFMEGIRPTETWYDIEQGVFYNFCKQAENDSNRDYFFIIDEINRGNLSKIFGELLMLIESDKRGEKLNLIYSKKPFSVPNNVYIIGMMNTADRSLALIDYALRRRFSFYNISPSFESKQFKKYQKDLDNEDFNKIIALIQELNLEIVKDLSLGEGFEIGHSYFCNFENITQNDMKTIIKYEIIPLVQEYWFDDKELCDKWCNKLNGVI